MEGYEKIEQRLMHQGKVVGFYEDIVKLPNGKVVTWDLVKHKGRGNRTGRNAAGMCDQRD